MLTALSLTSKSRVLLAALLAILIGAFVTLGMPAPKAHAAVTLKYISGTVTDFLGDPMSGVIVTVYDENTDGSVGTWEEDDTTDSAGKYKVGPVSTVVGLDPHPVPGYFVEITNDNDDNPLTGDVYYNGVPGGTPDATAATPVQNGPVDFKYADSPTATVHVSSKTGAALKDLELYVIPLEHGFADFSDADLPPAIPVPGEPNTYRLTGLAENQPYTLALFGDSIYSQFMGGAPSYGNTASSGNDSDPASFTLTSTRLSFDVTALSAPALSGTVTSTSGSKLKNVAVALYRFDGKNYNAIDSTGTNSKGAYTFPSEPSGSYKISFQPTGKYAAAWYGGGSEATAKAVYLDASSAKSASAKLVTGGTVSGTLKNVAGHALSNWGVLAYPLIGTPGHYTLGNPGFSTALTNSKGAYTVGGLGTGTYALSFFYVGDKKPTSADIFDPDQLGSANDTVSVKAGKSTTKSVTLPNASSTPTVAVTGQLTGAVEPLDPDASYILFNRVGSLTGTTTSFINANGSFTADLVPGTYRYFAFPEDDDETQYAEATDTITVTGDQTLTIPLALETPDSFLDPQPSVTASPTDSTEVGTTFTVGNINVTHANTAQLSYQWLRDGHPIYGATGTSYTATGSDAGSELSARVVDQGEGTTVTANPTAGTITPGGISYGAENQPSISPSDDVVVGTTLTAIPGVWTATDAAGSTTKGISFTYQWYRSGHGTNQLIEGATSRTYKTTATDADPDAYGLVFVVVTASKPGYGPSLLDQTPPVGVLQSAANKATTAPKSTSKTSGDSVIYTVGPGKWSVKGTTFTYQWYTDGQAIDGATTTTVSNPGGPNSAITVTVTAHAIGYQDKSVTVLAHRGINTESQDDPAVSVGQGNIINQSTPGDVHVGETLKAVPGDASFPQPQTAIYTYKWERDGVAIKGATKSSYVVAKNDIGHVLTLVSTISSAYYSAGAPHTSQAGHAVSGPIESLNGTVTATPTVKVHPGTKLTAKPSGFPSGSKYHYQWQSSFPIGVLGTASTLVVPADAANGQVWAQVTVDYAPKGGTEVTESFDSNYIDVIPATSLDTISPPTITGTASVGSKLTADPGIWNVTGAKYTYQWTRNGIDIPGATSSTYVPTSDTAGDNVTVKVSATKTGIASGSDESDAVKVSAGTLVNTTVPKVSGTVKDGSTLTASAGLWATGGLKFTYQWLDNGEEIPGATDSTYVVDATQLGANDGTVKLSVRVTASRPGYTDATAVSAATVAVPSVAPAG